LPADVLSLLAFDTTIGRPEEFHPMQLLNHNHASSCSGRIGSVSAVWLLLLSLVLIPQASAQNYQIAHCLLGCPLGSSADNHLILRSIYALSYNTNYKSADWVAYKINAESIGIASSLSRQAVVDEYVRDTLQPADFAASESLGLIRSQYVPLVGFAGTPYWNDVNYLTNAVARSSNLSQGPGMGWTGQSEIWLTGKKKYLLLLAQSISRNRLPRSW
jgi:hypothetical protein